MPRKDVVKLRSPHKGKKTFHDDHARPARTPAISVRVSIPFEYAMKLQEMYPDMSLLRAVRRHVILTVKLTAVIEQHDTNQPSGHHGSLSECTLCNSK